MTFKINGRRRGGKKENVIATVLEQLQKTLYNIRFRLKKPSTTSLIGSLNIDIICSGFLAS
jgi:hypothetical protein